MFSSFVQLVSSAQIACSEDISVHKTHHYILVYIIPCNLVLVTLHTCVNQGGWIGAVVRLLKAKFEQQS